MKGKQGMTRKDFIKAYSKSYKTTLDYARTICDSVFVLLGMTLYEQKKDVSYSGFGSFKHKEFKAKSTRHPGTGEMMVIPPRLVVKFTPAIGLRKSDNDESGVA